MYEYCYANLAPFMQRVYGSGMSARSVAYSLSVPRNSVTESLLSMRCVLGKRWSSSLIRMDLNP